MNDSTQIKCPAPGEPAGPICYAIPDGDLLLIEHFFDWNESDYFYKALANGTQWQEEKIKIFGKTVALPRLTAWYGNPGVNFTYSGIAMCARAWTPELVRIKTRIQEIAGVEFTGVLLNLYRTGQDSVSWHSDDEKELGKNPIIGSVSFGETRMFQMKHRTRKELQQVKIPLAHGSLLLMRGTTQQCWKHCVPKTSRPVRPRINLTFRAIR